jgi:hypothetical protein
MTCEAGVGIDAGVAEGSVFVTVEGEDGLVHLLGVERPQPHEEVEVLDGQSCHRAEQIGLQFGDDILERVHRLGNRALVERAQEPPRT